MKLLLSLSQEAQQQGVAARWTSRPACPTKSSWMKPPGSRSGSSSWARSAERATGARSLGSVTERILEASDLPVSVVSPRSS